MSPPITLVRLEHHPFGGVWIVARCPYCSKTHRHGGGGASEDARNFLGHRDAACRPEDVRQGIDISAGYLLREAPEPTGFTTAAPHQVESAPNSDRSKSADSSADTTTSSARAERVCRKKQQGGQPDGPTEKRDAEREPQVEPGLAEGCEIGRTTMSQMTMKDAVAKVASLNLPQLGRIYKKVVGQKPPKGTKLPTLQDALVDALKEQATGEGDEAVLNETAIGWLAEGDGKPEAPKAKPEKPVKVKKEKVAKEPRPRDERLPAEGEEIRKIWREKELVVRCLADGFEFEGKTYKSLSKLASELQGCSSNGFLFFGLTAGAKAAAARRAEREAAKETATPEAPVEEPKTEKKVKAAKPTKAKSGKKKTAKK